LPRFIPKNTKLRLDREEAIARLEQHNRAGKVATVWFQPVPYVNAICSCETPQCGGLRLRTDFGLKSVYKAEYAIRLNADECQACKLCVPMCQFGALRYSPSLKRVLVDSTKCFGCGLCRHACNFDALQLVPREEAPGLKGQY
jgi:NAD-dependent dihydropyrimidine dehydrogenase PreA subunit